MNARKLSGLLYATALAVALCAAGRSTQADEIRLKDGKKLYGVIVAYEDNMFKVKTEYGYVLVEKDKIASIVPTTPPAKPEPDSAKKDTAQHPSKPADGTQPQPESAVATASNTGASASPTNASVKTVTPSPNAVAKPGTSNASAAKAPAPGTNAPVSAATPAPAPAATAPAAPKEPEIPANREEITGNTYTNYT